MTIQEIFDNAAPEDREVMIQRAMNVVALEVGTAILNAAKEGRITDEEFSEILKKAYAPAILKPENED